MASSHQTKSGRPFRLTLGEWVQATAPIVAARILSDARVINRLFHKTTRRSVARDRLGGVKTDRMVEATRVFPHAFRKFDTGNGYGLLRHVSGIGLHFPIEQWHRFQC